MKKFLAYIALFSLSFCAEVVKPSGFPPSPPPPPPSKGLGSPNSQTPGSPFGLSPNTKSVFDKLVILQGKSTWERGKKSFKLQECPKHYALQNKAR
ncbi:TPA: hypothetical protein DDZ86_00640 [Candidatus Dependentiae bacterium]|nr:MAG: hypothetical protein UW09_C0004G0007 [candidate division TM6 bacterium GW2011_GWF2_43_87]HBL98131.1 hypothetical protein [Candidatus Dependentiae bacterium]